MAEEMLGFCHAHCHHIPPLPRQPCRTHSGTSAVRNGPEGRLHIQFSEVCEVAGRGADLRVRHRCVRRRRPTARRVVAPARQQKRARPKHQDDRCGRSRAGSRCPSPRVGTVEERGHWTRRQRTAPQQYTPCHRRLLSQATDHDQPRSSARRTNRLRSKSS